MSVNCQSTYMPVSKIWTWAQFESAENPPFYIFLCFLPVQCANKYWMKIVVPTRGFGTLFPKYSSP